ncbi:MAG: tetratricopeptide repeat-containing sulfotransferase family protein [Gammaproteobacteria bacterium]
MSDRAAEIERATQLNHQAEQLINTRSLPEAEQLLRQAIELDPESPAAWNNLGKTLNNLRRLDEAEIALRRSVGLDPDQTQAWFNLGHVQRALGRLVEAEVSARRALATEVDGEVRTLRLLASLRFMQGDPGEAIALLQEGKRRDPGDPLLILELADALRSAERFEEAAASYQECLGLDRSNADAFAGLGTVHHARLELEQSVDCFREALRLVPGHPIAETGLALVLELSGEYQAALDHVWPHLEDRDSGWAISAAGRLLRRLDRTSEAGELLDAADIGSMTTIDRISALTTLGQVREKAGEYDAAFDYFVAANDCLPSRFDAQGFRRSVDRIAAFFTREKMQALADSGCDSERPVFIVGMPRSGTSMIEQILGGHSEIVPCGERRYIFRLPRQLSGGDAESRWPEALGSIDRTVLRDLADGYLETAGLEAAECMRFTDKLPANFLNLGLIQMLFPHAHVVYCRRDPLDTGLSCFQQNFRSEGMDFARNLEHIGVQQQACWRLMDHWIENLSLPIMTIDYERLVSGPEEGARSLVEFLGLDWDSSCLDFHTSERIVRTASYEQVRQPVYTSSVGRWRPYESRLEPLSAALAEPWDSGSAQ